jgi:hypothetical protein
MTQAKSIFLQITRFSAQYAIWLVFTVSQLGLAIWMHQLVISAAILYAQQVKNPWLPRATDMWSMVILGIIVLIFVFLTEAYLSKGIRLQRFWQRVGMVAMIEALVAAGLLGLEFVL